MGETGESDNISVTMSIQSGPKRVCIEKVSWRIENFQIITLNENFVNYEKFSFNIGKTRELPETSWQLFLKANFSTSSSYNNGYGYNSKCYTCGKGNTLPVPTKMIDICCKPMLTTNQEKKVSALLYNASVSFLDKEGKKGSSPSGTKAAAFQKSKPSGSSSTYYENPASIVVLSFDANDPKLPLVDGCLVVEVTLEIYCYGEEEKICFNGDASKKCQEKAKQDFMDLLSSSESSDVVIKSKDGQTFPAHQLILRARSKHFDRMFGKDWREPKDGVIKLTKRSSYVKFLLQYIYTAKILPISWSVEPEENASLEPSRKRSKMEKTPTTGGTGAENTLSVEEVLDIANYYEFAELKHHVDMHMGIHCSEENALFLYDLCCKYSLESKGLIKTFIKNRPALLDQVFR